MELNQLSIFQILTKIDSTLKTYQEEQSDIDSILQISQELQNIKLNPQIIFEQFIPDQNKFHSLKSTLLKEILDSSPAPQFSAFEIENPQKIQPNRNFLPNIESSSEIISKISALKGEMMFINQELSIQPVEQNLKEEMVKILKRVSLRKLIKEYMRKNRKNPRIQSLPSICIRLVVVQESIIVQLGKSLAFFTGLLNQWDEIEANIMQMKKSVTSISSLSTSIQRYLETKNQSLEDQSSKEKFMFQQYGMHEPRIMSDFVFERVDNGHCLVKANGLRQKNKCCLWF